MLNSYLHRTTHSQLQQQIKSRPIIFIYFQVNCSENVNEKSEESFTSSNYTFMLHFATLDE